MSSIKGKGWGNTYASGNPVPGNITSCLEELGIDYRVSYDEAQAICPHPEHNDSHPSWSINTHTGVHNCFSCGFKGNFVSLVEAVLGVERSEAVRWTLKRGGSERVRERLDGRQEPFRVTDNDTTKLINEASLALFTLPPAEACAKRKFTQADCEALGVLWNPENETWVTPIRDPETHKLWGWQEKNAHVFRNRPRSIKKSLTLFGLPHFEGTTAVLVESPLDVVRLRAAGITGGVASFGVAVSNAQLRTIADYAEKLVVALDNDDPGIRKAEEIRRDFHLLPTYFFNYDVVPGNAKDPGDIDRDSGIRAGVAQAKSRAVAGRTTPKRKRKVIRR